MERHLGDPVSVDWDARYQAGETPWEKGAANPALVDWLNRNGIAGRVLVPGCGLGHDVRAVARAGALATGLDISALAVERARELDDEDCASYVEGDLFALPESLGAFDWVVEHTCFCAIPPGRRPEYARAVGDLLKPGGSLLAVFFIDPGMDDPEDGPPFGVSRAELGRFFDSRFDWVEEYVPDHAYPGRDGRELLAVLRRR